MESKVATLIWWHGSIFFKAWSLKKLDKGETDFCVPRTYIFFEIPLLTEYKCMVMDYFG